MSDVSDEVKKTVFEIESWLKDPQLHLGDQDRRKILEGIITSHFQKAVMKETLRNRARDFLLLASVATILATFAPKVLSFFGVNM